MTTTLSSVLVANRGEIALRVIRAARSLGIRSIAVYTDPDAGAPHTREADQAIHISSYLDIDAIIDAAREADAASIHPGYGFLSERAEFARAVEAAGIVLVGPSAAVMEQMGRKDAAREIAIAAGVPVVPTDARDFPVLVKAAAGGGGKGMRIVRSADEYDEAVAAARREAASAFGDDTILVEKYVERGRHIEVQVLADHHGTVVHLFERDCSTQRRHQKVLEEAPAPTISEQARQRVLDAAVNLAREVGYTNAGTVEFLLDEASGEAYFLEMNTRLQVEHPVTEAVVAHTPTGEKIDLVQLQLQIAAGAALPFSQDDLWVDGHAIEARIYAEDPFADFLPQAGTAGLVHWPAFARCDVALESGQVVSTAFDPMLGKVIVHGADREAARTALVRALDQVSILGLRTNTGFLRALAASDEFRDATIDTAWLDRNHLDAPDEAVARLFAAWAAAPEVGTGPLRLDGWRDGARPAPVVVELDRDIAVDRHSADQSHTGPGRSGTVDGVPVVESHSHAHRDQQGRLLGTRTVLAIDGVRHGATTAVDAHQVEVVHRGQRHVFARPDVFGDTGPALGDGTVVAPMPGTILDLRVATGDRVEADDVLGVVEAMKMELALKAPFAGVVTTAGHAVGDQVALGDVLFEVEPEEVSDQ
ncbi:biotin carboxylase N-terminal domain-containing protein [Nocardioides sp. AE5]|uniref:acetyl/propionyl/methylcrotonyl-CoA carboxylase subunit alpha n=1 Tax=Nocardioides sp. AE5 TaxID=2962573 RepID=UPI0028829454|nr:biotin carboxylase N-terminal domain-containing protein [Nocardioides sp. AE5]MDT0202332.1 biotin carboxylase N-terminal domain-containing protein [Nocardioides sp. AE5]